MKKIITRRAAIPTQNTLLHLHPVLQRIYSVRGIVDAQQLECDLNHLLPYETLSGIEAAVACLCTAVQQQQRILIVGDFDADGATSAALAVSALKAFGAQHVDYLVPNRFDYGYGLTPEIVAVAAHSKPDLLITVDNGIASCEGVAAAKELGIKVVITDHHLPGNILPAADAIVNPNTHGDNFPCKNLAGVGVIFYVMLALRSALQALQWFEKNQCEKPNMAQFLDLVALGTVADVVPLDHTNRILVQQGLRRIRAGKARPGIQALLKIANRDAESLLANDLGFAIAPRLNAAGRLDDMSLGIECLLSQNFLQALSMAEELDSLNQERKQIETDMKQQAFTILASLHLQEKSLPLGLCLYDESWHQGVIGILAARLKESFHRPTIIFAKASDTEIKGSARSIPALHIRDVLEAIATKHPGLINKFGGHAMAAGLSLPLANFEKFKKAFVTEVGLSISPEELRGEILSDGELSLEDFTLDFAELIHTAGPWGQCFPEPIFDTRFEVIEQRLVGNKHLKLTLSIAERKKLIEAIAFNIDLEKWPNQRVAWVHAAYRLDINNFQGRRKLQLIIEHLEAVS